MNTYKLDNMNKEAFSTLVDYIRYNLHITDVIIGSRKWKRVLPKDKLSLDIEKQISKYLFNYDRNINIYWLAIDDCNDLTLEYHITKSMTLEEYHNMCILYGMRDCITDDAFYMMLSSMHY